MRRRRRLLLLGVGVVAAVVVWGIVWGGWLRSARPPVVDLKGVDPGIAEAIESARRDVEQKPRSAAAWGHLAMVLRAHDFNVDAEVCFARAEKLDPDEPRWPYLRALILLRGDPDAGIASLRRAVELAGAETTPRLRLAGVLESLGRFDEAEDHFKQVLSQETDNPRAHLGLARLAFQRGDLEASLTHLQASLAGAPGVRSSHALLAEIRFRKGEQAAAEEALRTVDRLKAGDPWPDPYLAEVERLRVGVGARISQARMLLEQGQVGQAVELLQETVNQHPDSYEAHLTLGHTALLRLPAQFAPGAERALREAVRLKGDSFDARFYLAAALQRQEKFRAAVEVYDQALSLKPQHAQAHFNRGICLRQEGDRDGAIQAFEMAVRFKPDLTEGYRDLGELLARAGRDAEALKQLEQAGQLRPTDEKAKRLLEEVRKRVRP
jgi:tetratricopeptide (TPR) repeat protein